ncbi:MAG TPA: hypothetical protein VGC95_10465 [Chitinophagaceae bacterium]|jgi:hypothetical protein
MRRSKYGYLLLALLVITGLAGTVTSGITSKERKLAANNLKESRNEVINALKGLTPVQLKYRDPSTGLRINDLAEKLISTENSLWHCLEAGLRNASNPEQRVKIRVTDEQLFSKAANDCFRAYITPSHGKLKLISARDLDQFKLSRLEHIKYIKGTTEDLRNHVVKLTCGWIDCYQLMLLISANSENYYRAIESVKSAPGFPVK